MGAQDKIYVLILLINPYQTFAHENWVKREVNEEGICV